MKKFWIQLIIILGISLVTGLTLNYFSGESLPVFKAFTPRSTTPLAEDLSVYYREIDAETLNSLLESKMVVLFDARTNDMYSQGHIPGAYNFPIGEFQQKYPTISPLLPGDKDIVLYCIGVHCIDSSLLAKELYNKGHKQIFVFKGGIEEWESMGYPVETSSPGGENTNENQVN